MSQHSEDRVGSWIPSRTRPLSPNSRPHSGHPNRQLCAKNCREQAQQNPLSILPKPRGRRPTRFVTTLRTQQQLSFEEVTIGRAASTRHSSSAWTVSAELYVKGARRHHHESARATSASEALHSFVHTIRKTRPRLTRSKRFLSGCG
jgi:hypothetical protein